MDWVSEAHEGPAGLRGCGQRQELGCRPKGHKRRGQSSSVQRAGWTLVARALHLWGAGTHRLKGTPWSLPQPPALGAWGGGQPGMWRGGQAASGARGALLGQRGTREVRGFRAPMTGRPPKPKLSVCLFPASLSPAGSARICGEFRRGARPQGILPGAAGQVQKNHRPGTQPPTREVRCRPGAADSRKTHSPTTALHGNVQEEAPRGHRVPAAGSPRAPALHAARSEPQTRSSGATLRVAAWRKDRAGTRSEQGGCPLLRGGLHLPSARRGRASPRLGALRLTRAGGSGAGEEGTEGSARPHWTPATPGPAGLLAATPGA